MRLGSYSSSDLVVDVVTKCCDFAEHGDVDGDVVQTSLLVLKGLCVVVPIHENHSASIGVVPYSESVVSIAWWLEVCAWQHLESSWIRLC